MYTVEAAQNDHTGLTRNGQSQCRQDAVFSIGNHHKMSDTPKVKIHSQWLNLSKSHDHKKTSLNMIIISKKYLRTPVLFLVNVSELKRWHLDFRNHQFDKNDKRRTMFVADFRTVFRTVLLLNEIDWITHVKLKW